MSPAETVALFLINEVKKLYTKNWIGSKLTLTAEPQNLGPIDVIKACRLRGISNRAHNSLIQWHNKIYPIELIDYIPLPLEMLHKQCRGERFVSIVDQTRISLRGIDKSPLEFAVHDLEHADKYFSNQSFFKSQLQFFNKLQELHNSKILSPQITRDSQFKKDFEYAISDMNSHPEHMQQFLLATLLQSFLRLEGKNSKDILSMSARFEYNALANKINLVLSKDFNVFDFIKA